jgi:hypothetical protein
VKIAFVVQRYGTEILGGSEYHCRLVAERLAVRHQVDVLTTCSRDYITWANDYPEGPDRLRGVTVRRFATSRTRDLASFNRMSEKLYHERHTPQDELEWLKQQAPAELRRHRVLHVPLRTDRARDQGRSVEVGARTDGARRAANPVPDVSRCLRRRRCHRLEHRRRAAVRLVGISAAHDR